MTRDGTAAEVSPPAGEALGPAPEETSAPLEYRDPHERILERPTVDGAEGGEWIRFVFDDATAARVPLAACPLPLVPRLEFRWGAPDWAARPDVDGFLALELARELAPIAAARLTSDAIALFALDAVPGRVYELPRVVRQALILESAEAVSLRIAIGSRDLYRFHSSLESPMASGKSGWVDEVSVRAAELDAPRGHLLAAWKAVTLQSSQAAAPIRLPVGSYWIQPLECSFGWWMEQLDLEVDGGPIVLRPYRTPIVRIISPLDLEHARVEKVALLFDRQDGVTAKTRGEIEVPWRESGVEVEASMYWRASDERGMLYAIRVYWDSGEERTSSLVSWSALEGPVPLLE